MTELSKGLVQDYGVNSEDTASMEQAIASRLDKFFAQDKARVVTKAKLDDASEKVRGIRESVLRELATLATMQNWSQDGATDVIKKIANSYGQKGKTPDKTRAASMATFKRDLVLCVSVKLRPHVNRIFDVAHEVFAQEKIALDALEKGADAAEKRAVAPVKTAFSRAYHAAVQSMAAVRDHAKRDINLPMSDAAAMTFYAQQYMRDRKFDPARAKARLDAIAADLESFHGEYALDVLKQCSEFLRAIEESSLKAGHTAAKAAHEAEIAQELGENEDAESDPDDALSEALADDDALAYAVPELEAA